MKRFAGQKIFQKNLRFCSKKLYEMVLVFKLNYYGFYLYSYL